MRIASPGRVAVIASLAAAVALGSGCSWFRKDNDAYKLSGEARPLEVPPDLDRPATDGAMTVPAQSGGSVMASSAGRGGQSAAAPSGFNLAGVDRDAAFARVGDALAAADADPQVRAVIVTGAGDKSFCAGADLVALSRGESLAPEDPSASTDRWASPAASPTGTCAACRRWTTWAP